MGLWKDDKFHGDGLYLYSNGDKYKGKFEKGMKKGRGVYIYRNGATYEGEWDNDKKSGNGTYIYINK